MRYEGKPEPKWSWRKVICGAVIGAIIILAAGPIAAHANVKDSWSTTSPQCYRYSITEYRTGIIHFITGQVLWRAQQQVHWCHTDGVGVWKGPNTNRACSVSITWATCHLDKKWTHELHNPHRWQFYAKWTMDSNGANLLVDHDHPWIYMTVFAKNPQHVSYTASCGC